MHAASMTRCIKQKFSTRDVFVEYAQKISTADGEAGINLCNHWFTILKSATCRSPCATRGVASLSRRPPHLCIRIIPSVPSPAQPSLPPARLPLRTHPRPPGYLGADSHPRFRRAPEGGESIQRWRAEGLGRRCNHAELARRNRRSVGQIGRGRPNRQPIARRCAILRRNNLPIRIPRPAPANVLRISNPHLTHIHKTAPHKAARR